MARQFDMAWDYYLQGFRLHNRMGREGNLGAQEMFQKAIALSPEFARAYSHLSFTILTGWLNDWIAPGQAQALGTKLARRAQAQARGAGEPIRAPARRGKARAARSPLADIPDLVLGYAKLAVAYGPDDYDNHWSLATANLYAGNVKEGLDGYEKALDLAEKQGAPDVNRASIVVDRADALFYTAPLNSAGNAQVQRAIADTEKAIEQNANDPKRHHWNWTLGWAYYEAENYAKSLEVLLRFQKPHDLIRKNIIASYAALGMTEQAQLVAGEFRRNNSGYDLSIEDRWPYHKDRLARWKEHLGMGGLGMGGLGKSGVRRRPKRARSSGRKRS